MDFVHLQVYSSYTLMKSAVSIDKVVKEAKQKGFNALALTDEHVLHGSYQFVHTCREYGIKPIVGMSTTIYIADELRPVRFILLAKSETGFQSLVGLSNRLHINEEHITLSELATLPDIIPIVSFYHNVFEELIYLQDDSRMSDLLSMLDRELGDWYINLQPNANRLIENWLYHNGRSYQSQVVVTDNVRFVQERDVIGYQALQAIDHQATIDQQSSFQDTATHLKSLNEYDEDFVSEWAEAFKRTNELAQACDISMTQKWFDLPVFPKQTDQSSEEMLKALCERGVKQKYSEDRQRDAYNRLYHELEIINNRAFADYFLIVWDLVKYAKQAHILVGPGRGSAAGSIVAYLLNITDVDPIKHELLFERFLNPERQSMPDIDIDFSDYRRDDVLQYVKNKYGDDRVAQIITFGTFQSRSTIRELAKVFQISREQLNYLLQAIPQHATQLRGMVQDNSSLKQYISESDVLKKMFQAAFVIEGLPRHHSVHAAGVVISDRPLTDRIPMFPGSDGVLLTQLPMGELESLGLLKMDFLGLRNLTLIERMLSQINQREGKPLTLNNIPSHDSKTFQLLQRGFTTGVFQLESSGMKKALRLIQPTTFADVVAVISLYRPGPMQFIDTFANRKHRRESVDIIHDDLAPILNETYGVLVYQEQIMQIASQLAGFSMSQADLLRRAISKKDREQIEELRQSFLNGVVEQGYEESLGVQLFDWIEHFADYGFNKSHAVAYSMIAYQLAYFKAHYPAYFYAELLSQVMHDSAKLEMYIKEARQIGVRVLPPSVNESFGKFTVKDVKTIRFGLLAIKGLGKQAYDDIVRARGQSNFQGLFDFCKRVSLNIVTRPILESLIIVGSFDDIHSNRAQLLASVVQAMDQGELFSGMDEMFNMNVQYTDVPDFSLLKAINMEKEVMGFRISEHPLKNMRRSLTRQGYVSIQQFKRMRLKQVNKLTVTIHQVKTIRTKRGEQMAFVTLEDETGEMDGVIFPQLYRQIGREVDAEKTIQVSGQLDERQGSKQVILQHVTFVDLDELEQDSQQKVFIKLLDGNEQEQLEEIKRIQSSYPGQSPITVYSNKQNQVYQLAPSFDLHISDDSIKALKAYFKDDHVVVKS
ncbi:DNA polymerase-3 subunit alpha [Alkalibacillus flavidus]|uniref:DNA polymerase III subunit alpha n=1 Tax=Alkalibacillus flavidus TaxID=546021 RepID=A0ABV2KST0_9BACI